VSSIDMLFLICNNSTGNEVNWLLFNHNVFKLIKLQISAGNEVNWLLIKYNSCKLI
jgi:hypothetical protein